VVEEDRGDFRIGYQDFLVDSTNGAIRVALNGSDVEVPYPTWHDERTARPGAWCARARRWASTGAGATTTSSPARATGHGCRCGARRFRFPALARGRAGARGRRADVGCWHTHRLVPRSVVGSLISFDDFEEDVCGHAPHDVARRLTLEFSRPGPTVYRTAELESPRPSLARSST